MANHVNKELKQLAKFLINSEDLNSKSISSIISEVNFRLKADGAIFRLKVNEKWGCVDIIPASRQWLRDAESWGVLNISPKFQNHLKSIFQSRSYTIRFNSNASCFWVVEEELI